MALKLTKHAIVLLFCVIIRYNITVRPQTLYTFGICKLYLVNTLLTTQSTANMRHTASWKSQVKKVKKPLPKQNGRDLPKAIEFTIVFIVKQRSHYYTMLQFIVSSSRCSLGVGDVNQKFTIFFISKNDQYNCNHHGATCH